MELKKYKLGDCLTMIENGAVIKLKNPLRQLKLQLSQLLQRWGLILLPKTK